MATYLFTWNPATYPFENLENTINRVSKGEEVEDRWSTGVTKKIRKNDRFFLMRLGQEPKGIFASGYVVSDAPFEGEHWASDLKAALYVDIVYDRMVAPEGPLMLSLNRLEEIEPQFSWTPQASGLTLPDGIADAVEDAWAEQNTPRGPQRRYYVIGTKYGPSNMDDVLDKMTKASVVSVDWATNLGSLESLFGKDEKTIVADLKRRGEPNNSVLVLKRFLTLKAGDLIALKGSGQPRGTAGHLSIRAIAVAVERNGAMYSFSADLGHCVNVEYIKWGPVVELPIGSYARAADIVSKPEHIAAIFGTIASESSADIAVKLREVRTKKRSVTFKSEEGHQRTVASTYLTSAQHNALQNALASALLKVHGEGFVAMEENWEDITIENDDGSLTIYEVKPYADPELCIRAALGQLLHYSFRRGEVVRRIVAVGPSPIDDGCREFLDYIKSLIGIEFDYQSVRI
ncbi:MAG TPA: hypothetical protein VG537_05830 [Candidatus Kapabacteria bacterium]|jgi:hypothetical protein|nr:hypothetical protein [Candidatus Kapabacteria bacterium]